MFGGIGKPLDIDGGFTYARAVTYPGGKNGPGVYQTIINQIPPHRIYIEPFAGSGAIYRYKRLADLTYLIDKDSAAVAALQTIVDREARRFRLQRPPAAIMPIVDRADTAAVIAPIGDRADEAACVVICADAISFLRSYKWAGGEFVYADPPYLDLTRRRQRQIYTHEIQTTESHNRILDVLATLPCAVMISGYWSELYGQRLAAWRVVRFQATVRGGKRAAECLWMNYPQPVALHDYGYLGRDSRERQDIKRMKDRWVKRLEGMPLVKRQALLAAINESDQT